MRRKWTVAVVGGLSVTLLLSLPSPGADAPPGAEQRPGDAVQRTGPRKDFHGTPRLRRDDTGAGPSRTPGRPSYRRNGRSRELRVAVVSGEQLSRLDEAPVHWT